MIVYFASLLVSWNNQYDCYQVLVLPALILRIAVDVHFTIICIPVNMMLSCDVRLV